MTVNEVYPEVLFSYGTLQLEAVQMATFGRQLAGTSDALRGFELVLLKIEDQTGSCHQRKGAPHHGQVHRPRFRRGIRNGVCGHAR